MMQWMFVLALFGLVAIPLVPSIRVWRLRIDSRPLRIRTHYGFGKQAANDTEIRDARNGLDAGRDARLTGSVQTDKMLFVDAGSTFERLEGRLVHFGPWESSPAVSSAPLTAGPVAREAVFASTVAGDLVIEAGQAVEHPLIVRGSLTIGKNARVYGAVKAYGDVHVGALARVDGPIFSSGSIFLDEDSSVSGPVVADEVIRMAPGVTVGSPQIPTTIAGRVVEARVGARVFGIVHSTEQGRVVE